ncbi:MAG: BMP family ABC transporter substrate-binding protein, partial [Thermodesulfobacteriota bacterium]|nr:BMP family ABC transporter substrate-binding protein [Thermodesulfobacteriota bacterium]
YGKDSVVSGQLMNWGGMYLKILEDIHNKTWTNKDIWWLAAENAAILGGSADEPVNLKFIDDLKKVEVDSDDFGKISAYDLVMKRYAQMKKGVKDFDPYDGPIKDNKGSLKIKKGERASVDELLNIMYYVDNVKGSIPK